MNKELSRNTLGIGLRGVVRLNQDRNYNTGETVEHIELDND